MYIQCPKCGRPGRLPDRWVSKAQRLRCRRCQTMFQTPDIARLAADRPAGPAFGAVAGRAHADAPTALLEDSFFSGFDDPMLPGHEPGPGDSSYELTFSLADTDIDDDTDGHGDAPLIAPEAPSSDEIPALSAADGRAAWPHRFLDSWGARLLAAILVAIAALILAILGLLASSYQSPEPAGPTTPLLIAGLACAAALLTLAVPLLLLAASLSPVLRDPHHLLPRR